MFDKNTVQQQLHAHSTVSPTTIITSFSRLALLDSCYSLPIYPSIYLCLSTDFRHCRCDISVTLASFTNLAISLTSNVTGCHQCRKRKLQAGYRAPSLKCMSCCNYFPSSSVVSHALSALCTYSKFTHHPHAKTTFVPNFISFAAFVAELAPG